MKRLLIASTALAGLCLPAILPVGQAMAQEAQPPAPAAAPAPTASREVVVVTAQKRDEDIQDVPISITAFSGENLEEAGIVDIRDLRNITPSLNLATAPQLANTRVEIRGIGTSGNTAIEPSVALFLDGAYVPRTAALVSGLNDIRSVEVLRGPQGTLFGRNASMGAMLVTTNEPTNEFGGKLTALAGNFNRQKLEAVLNVPIGDTFAVRGAVLGDKRDGYATNLLNGKDVSFTDTFSGRLSAAWDITPDIRWVVRADHQQTVGDGIPISTVVTESVTPTFAANWRARLDPDGAGPLQGQLPIINNTYTHFLNQESEGNLQDHTEGVTSNLTWDFGDGWQVKLINAWRDWNDDQYQVSSGTLPIQMPQRRGFFASEAKSHELQLTSPTLLDDRATFVAGLYRYDEDFYIGDFRALNPDTCNIFIRNSTADTPAGTRARRVAFCNADVALPYSSYTNFWQTTESWAAFVQGTYDILPNWDVTLGVRYSADDKTGLFDQRSLTTPIPGIVPGTTIASVDAAATERTQLATDGTKVTYRVGTTYNVTPDVMLFATWSTGFKSGGFDSGRNTTVVGQARIFAPETTENTELGVKSELFNGLVTANATLFRTDIEEYQFRTYDGISFAVRNNGAIRQQGVEFETIWRPLDPLTVNFSGTYLDSEYLDFRGAPNWPGLTNPASVDLTGERAPYSPEWQLTGYARWEDQLPWASNWTWSLRGDFQYVDDRMLSATGDNYPLNNESSFTTYGARLGFRNDNGLSLALIGQNLTDDIACTSRYAQPNNAALGLVDTVNGGTVLRCVVTPPRTWAFEVSKDF
jgi:iron complex outermembrane receptor protein